MLIKLLTDGLVMPYAWPKKAGDIVDINPRDVQQNIDSGLAESVLIVPAGTEIEPDETPGEFEIIEEPGDLEGE